MSSTVTCLDDKLQFPNVPKITKHARMAFSCINSSVMCLHYNSVPISIAWQIRCAPSQHWHMSVGKRSKVRSKVKVSGLWRRYLECDRWFDDRPQIHVMWKCDGSSKTDYREVIRGYFMIQICSFLASLALTVSVRFVNLSQFTCPGGGSHMGQAVWERPSYTCTDRLSV